MGIKAAINAPKSSSTINEQIRPGGKASIDADALGIRTHLQVSVTYYSSGWINWIQSRSTSVNVRATPNAILTIMNQNLKIVFSLSLAVTTAGLLILDCLSVAGSSQGKCNLQWLNHRHLRTQNKPRPSLGSFRQFSFTHSTRLEGHWSPEKILQTSRAAFGRLLGPRRASIAREQAKRGRRSTLQRIHWAEVTWRKASGI